MSGLVVAASVVVLQGIAHAATAFYIAPNGSDTNSGSVSAPFGTINKFMSVAQPGDTAYLRGGQYNICESYLTKSGTVGNYITIRNYPGETPALDGGGTCATGIFYGVSGQGPGNGSYIVIDGLVVRNYTAGGINLGCCGGTGQQVSHVIIRNNVVDRIGQNGITVMRGGDILVEHNLVGRTGWNPDRSWSSGINFYEMYGTNNIANGNVSYHNVDVSSYHTDGNGFICDLTYYAGGCKFRNNLAFENGGSGIQATNSSNIEMTNNTSHNNGKEPTYIYGGSGLGFYGEESLKNATVRNNIAYQTFGDAFRLSGSFTSSTVANNFPGDPKFVDPDNADFQVRDDSPVIDAGTTAGATGDSLYFDPKALLKTTDQPVSWYRFAPDFDYIAKKGGVATIIGSANRPQGNGPDVGAFESGATSSTPPTSTPTATATTTGPSGTNVITNGEFDDSTAGWWTYFHEPAAGSISTVDGALGSGQALKLDLSNGADGDWEAQVGQTVSLTAGRTYQLSFHAKADAARSVAVTAQRTTEPYTDYIDKSADLSTTGRTFTYSFTPAVSGDVYIKIQAGGNDTDVYLDSVSLTG